MGLALLIVPSSVAWLVFVEELAGIAIPIARVTGIAVSLCESQKTDSKDRKFTPARKVPSASSVKSTRLIAGAGNICRTPDSSTIFIVTKMATQWSACVHNRRKRAGLSLACPHSVTTQKLLSPKPKTPNSGERLVRDIRVGYTYDRQR